VPKITDAQYVADVNGTGYIIGYQDGVFCRWPVTMAVANKWLSGDDEPNAGTGNNDDFYLNTTTGDVYQKEDGAWSLIVNINGTDGATWRFGSGVPSSGLGVDGDFYLDEATYYIYEKSSGAWVPRGCIKGADGSSSSGCPDYILQIMGVV
jgi:hypothetical protein